MIQVAEAPISEVYLDGIEWYDSREAYERIHGAGTLPPFDRTRDRRRWVYTKAAQHPRPRIEFRGVATREDGLPLVEHGEVVLETFSLSREEAGAPPNIPSKEDVWQELPYTRVLPVPLRPLERLERLVVKEFAGANVVVRRIDLWEQELAKDPQQIMRSQIEEILAIVRALAGAK